MKIFKIIVAVVLLGLLSGFETGYAQSPSDTDLSVQFRQAGMAYQSEDYQKAIELYEGVVRSGSVSGAVYYNLGNSYFKKNQLGRAVLNYERAKRLLPRDNDLNANDHYAVSLIKNGQGPSRESFLVRGLDNYAEYFTLDEVTGVLFFFFFLTGGFYFLGLFLRWPARNYVAAIVLSCGLLFFHGFIFVYKINRQNKSAVAVEAAPAKFEPLENATIYFELPEGEKVKILKAEEGWSKIQRPDGKLGWVKQSAVEKI